MNERAGNNNKMKEMRWWTAGMGRSPFGVSCTH